MSDIGGTLAELSAALGIDMDQAAWDAAIKTVGAAEKKLQDLVKAANATGKVKPPKLPLTDEQEAMKILERRLKKGRVDALLASTDINKALGTIGFPPNKKDDEKTTVEKKTEGMLSTLGKVRLATLAFGWAAVSMGKGLVGMGEQSIESASKIHDMAQSTGFSTDALQEFKFAAEQSGSSLEAVVGASKKLNLVIEKTAKTGKGPAVEALKDLGLSAKQVQKEISQGGLDAGITLVSEKLKNIDDPAKKARIAIALLGKSGQNLIPTLTDLSDLREDARNLGLVIAEDDINAMEAFGDEMGRVSGAIGGIKNQFVAALIPALTKITDGILGWIKANRELIKTAVDKAVDATVTAINFLIEAGGVVAGVIQFFAQHSVLAISIIEALTAVMIAFGVAALVAWIEATWPILLIIAAAFALSLAINEIIELWPKIADAARRAWAAVVSAITGAWGAAVRAWQSFADWFTETLPTAIVSGWNAMWDEIGKIADEAWEGLKDLPVIKQIIQVNRLLSGGNLGGVTPESVAQLQAQSAEQLAARSASELAVSPSQAAAGSTSLTIGEINVTSPNADPRQVADAVKPAMREFMDDELRKARK